MMVVMANADVSIDTECRCRSMDDNRIVFFPGLSSAIEFVSLTKLRVKSGDPECSENSELDDGVVVQE